MKQIIPLFLNLPWSLAGLLLSLLSGPMALEVRTRPIVLIIRVRSFWWYAWLPGKRYVRAITNGNVIQLGPHMQTGDLEHELVHVEQGLRAPFIYPLLSAYLSLHHGYAGNKYEREAYNRAHNPFRSK